MSSRIPPVKAHTISDSESDDQGNTHTISDSDSDDPFQLRDAPYGVSGNKPSQSWKRKRPDPSGSDSDNTISNSPKRCIISLSSDDSHSGGEEDCTGGLSSQSLLAQSKKMSMSTHTISDSDSESDCVNVKSEEKVSTYSSHAVEKSFSSFKSDHSQQEHEISDSSDSTVDLQCTDSSKLGHRTHRNNESSHSSSDFSRVKKNHSSRAAPSQQEHQVSDSSESTIDLQSVDSCNLGNSDQTNDKLDDRPLCRYGSRCYRKNPSHFEEYKHPGNTEFSAYGKTQDCVSTLSSTASRTSSALGFMLTKAVGIKPSFNEGIALDIKDILSPSFGNLIKSVQFNYSIDIQWLVDQYPKQFRTKPLLVVHGCQRVEKKALEADASPFNHVQLCQAKLDIPYGTHHTKMMILLYEEGLRIVIHTANLVHGDWHQKTQGIWLSPLFPKHVASDNMSGGDSVTHFKQDLIQYITAYRARPLEEWVKVIEQYDMSTARVFLVGSVPGRHTNEKKSSFGHLKLRKILETHGPTKLHVQNWPLIGQFSSIGSLGPNKETWMYAEWLESLATTRGRGNTVGRSNVKIHLIYPSKENVRLSLEGYAAGGALPYSINVAKKQPWLHDYFCQWKSEICGRSQASPHIKSYLRISPDWQNIAWFLITSANLSKAAWGALEKNGSQLMIRSYELGVLFLPEQFSQSHSFYRQKSLGDTSACLDDKQLPFCLPYDVPPMPYTKQDRPWIWDIPYVDKPDTHGNKWCPS